MLLRPTRPLPRRFNRRVSDGTRKFVERRHKRHKEHVRARWIRVVRRAQRSGLGILILIRRWIWLALAAVAVSAAAFVSFSPIFHVREIRIQRTDARIDSDRVQLSLKSVFGKHLFFLAMPEIQRLIGEAVPDLANVEMQKHYPSTLAVRITLKPIVARLDIVSPASGQGAQEIPASGEAEFIPEEVKKFDYMTDAGTYVSLPLSYSGVSLPVIRIVDWAVRPLPGTPILPPEFIERLTKTERVMEEQFGLNINQRSVYLRAREFHLSTGQLSLWFDMTGTLEEQVGRYRLFLRTIGLKDVRRYIDLRLRNRVVYQ